MKILVDMQGLQTEGSRNRGIGRYTKAFVYALCKNSDFEVTLLLNGAFSETLESIEKEFERFVPKDHIKVFTTPRPVHDTEPSNDWRRRASESLREFIIFGLNPDLVLITSLFEGGGDDAVLSIGKYFQGPPTAIILYDLIPYIYKDIYLSDPKARKWYERKLDHLRRADLFFAISESTRQEAINYLGFSEDLVINVSTAVDEGYGEIDLSEEEMHAVSQKYGIQRPYVMYTGGIDHRKNIEGLIESYSMLSDEVRDTHQLVIVCSLRDRDRERLLALASELGLARNELVLTGFVSDQELIALYSSCRLFVFPSWHEGFGLPVLEAMNCGATVIASNCSSLIEVVGCADALFDPYDLGSLNLKINQCLTDEDFRLKLSTHHQEQIKEFSWDKSALRAIGAIEKWRESRQQQVKTTEAITFRRCKLAFVSPVPPMESGIADYASEMLVELSKFYEVEVISDQAVIADPWLMNVGEIRSVDWFKEHYSGYDRVVYQFGNSTFHEHMFDLLELFPGVVVLHDFFLSGIVSHQEFHTDDKHYWSKELYASHGYPALIEKLQETDNQKIVWKYPCNFSVISNALAIISHSEYSKQLCNYWYGNETAGSYWQTVPMPRRKALETNTSDLRKKLGFKQSDFIVCSFGMVGPTKRNMELLEAWRASALDAKPNCHLVFVGGNGGGEYGEQLQEIVQSSARLKATGYVSMETYKQYLSIADVAVQLRSISRGETSAAVYDCMNYGVPLIVNNHGSLADISEDHALKLEDDFSIQQLSSSLERTYSDVHLRTKLSKRARALILEKHQPASVAKEYFDVIEKAYGVGNPKIQQMEMAKTVSAIEPYQNQKVELGGFVKHLAHNSRKPMSARQIFVDVSLLVWAGEKQQLSTEDLDKLAKLTATRIEGYRVEPFYRTKDEECMYAKSFTLALHRVDESVLSDDQVWVNHGDLLIDIETMLDSVEGLQADDVEKFFDRRAKKLRWLGDLMVTEGA